MNRLFAFALVVLAGCSVRQPRFERPTGLDRGGPPSGAPAGQFEDQPSFAVEDFRIPGPRKGAPRWQRSGRVTAQSAFRRLVVLNLGRDQGIHTDDEFIIHRGGIFVARVYIDRVDRQWSCGRIIHQREDPRIADEVTNDPTGIDLRSDPH